MRTGFQPSGRMTQGKVEVVAGDAVQLVAQTTPCSRVWIGPGTTAHVDGVGNSGTVLVGFDALGTAQGNGTFPITSDNYTGATFLVDDASKIYIGGTQDGDVAHYIIFD